MAQLRQVARTDGAGRGGQHPKRAIGIMRQPGANWVGAWYARNLRIFNNVLHLTDRSQDRILVVYGHGHAYLLRQFATESRAFRLVDVDAVLKNK